MGTVRIAAAQTAEYVDDIDAALQCIADFSSRAESAGASLLCFPEAFLQGYLTEPTEARRVAVDIGSLEFAAILERLPQQGPMLVIGLIEREGSRLFNTAIVVHRGVLVGRYRKTHLLAGEQVFEAGTAAPKFEVENLSFGINICNDTNFPEAAARVAQPGVSLIVCPANNMMPRARAEVYRDLHNAARGERCRETGLWLISADVTGERDDRLGLGPTAVLNPVGEVVARLPLGASGLLLFDLPVSH